MSNNRKPYKIKTERRVTGKFTVDTNPENKPFLNGGYMCSFGGARYHDTETHTDIVYLKECHPDDADIFMTEDNAEKTNAALLIAKVHQDEQYDKAVSSQQSGGGGGGGLLGLLLGFGLGIAVGD